MAITPGSNNLNAQRATTSSPVLLKCRRIGFNWSHSGFESLIQTSNGGLYPFIQAIDEWTNSFRTGFLLTQVDTAIYGTQIFMLEVTKISNTFIWAEFTL
jgi:hypothetical protein